MDGQEQQLNNAIGGNQPVADETSPHEDFIDSTEVAQEVVVNDEAPPVDDDESEDDDTMGMEGQDDMDNGEGEQIEIDMTNNSITYFDKHTDSVFCITHHPKLPLICTGGADNIAHLWTSHTQPPRFAGSLEGHKESVIGCAFSSNGQFLITADMVGHVLIHRAKQGGARWELSSEIAEVEEVVWLQAHPTLPAVFAFGALDGSVWCYQIDENSGTPQLLMSGFSHTLDCTQGRFVETNDLNVCELITTSLDSTIVRWNCYTGVATYRINTDKLSIPINEAPWVSIDISPKEDLFAVGASNGIIVVGRTSDGAILHSARVAEPTDINDPEDMDASVEALSWAKDFPLLAVGVVNGNVITLATTNWQIRHKFELGEAITKLKFDGLDLFASCISGKVHQVDARSGAEKFVCLGHNMGVMDFVIVSQDGKRRVITAGDEGVSLVFDVPN
ncbi:hypothetical protein TBLA_0D04560 [Henningerozyma blattae CBS 6284]|uniref:Anaphase-promoting complex subunit 4-like WD40 domain-containing protein n=1 Tax=Henningerozyma blattae (strain ATCC 34711 / CBS 6284 / DSM 70876 / NBRC 10599 / NRRL Y-10934 / UCD 77-7) TaxID=1071380 RepID=I2H3K0_HENB6|nr:hypothetical protein TBLA_0D04560 [Tetrapisispora blattae CBS 6284]CCH60952.1 hypothetical protein TBLA_0D04560 [Tetrapisispora blattae CBS 6284]